MVWGRTERLATRRPSKACCATLRIGRALSVVLMLEAAQRQGRYRQSMHRAVNAYKLLIIALDHGFLGSLWRPTAFAVPSSSLAKDRWIGTPAPAK